MADENTTGMTPNDTAQLVMSDIQSDVEKLGNAVQDILSKAGIEGSKEILKNLVSMAEKAASTLKGVDFFAGIEQSAEDGAKKAEGIYDKLKKKLMTDAESNPLMLAIGLDQDKVKNIFESLGGIATPEFGIKIGAYLAADQVFQGIESIGGEISKQEDKILKFTQTAFENLKGSTAAITTDIVGGADAAGRTFGTMTDAATNYRQQVIGLQEAWGVSGTQAEEAINEMLKGGLVMEQVGQLSAKMADGTKAVSGLEAAFVAAKATGLEYSDVGKTLNEMTRSLGVKTEEAAQKFELFANVQSGSKMKIGDVKAAVMDASKEFRFFGDNIDGAASLYKGFIRSLGEGKEELAAKIFGEVIKGIKGMDDGMKAFLGMTTGIGTGGGGAIGGVLEVEEAFATGEGLDKVVAGIKESVESLSGGALMTRREAIEGGRQQEYFKQREFLKQQTGVQDAGQLDEIIKMLQTQDLGGIREALTKGGPGAGFDRERVGQMATVEAGGGTAQALNRLEAGRRRMQEGMVNELIKAGGGLNEQIRKGFDEPLKELQRIFKAENFTKELKGAIQRGRDEAAIARDERDRAASRKAVEAEREAGGKGPTLEGHSAQGKVLKDTGRKTSEMKSDRAEVDYKTGRRLGESLGAAVEAASNTQRESLEKLTAATEVYAKTGRKLSASMNAVAKSEKMTGRTTSEKTPKPFTSSITGKTTSETMPELFTSSIPGMTRKEAIDTGQGEAFVKQREALNAAITSSGGALTKESLSELSEVFMSAYENMGAKEGDTAAATGAGGIAAEEKEITVRVKLVADPEGNLNIVQLAEKAAEDKIRGKVGQAQIE